MSSCLQGLLTTVMLMEVSKVSMVSQETQEVVEEAEVMQEMVTIGEIILKALLMLKVVNKFFLSILNFVIKIKKFL